MYAAPDPSDRSLDAAGFAAPSGTRIYAIGDIHGRADLLRQLRGMILADAAGAECARKLIVHIGDYIDRGAASREVVDILLDEPLPGFEVVNLKGNHEDFLLRFLDDRETGSLWFMNGGAATLRSYGVHGSGEGGGDEWLRRAGEALRRSLPPRHLAFFRALALRHREGDYLFVHAGIRPGVAIDRQRADDLLWIRDEFLRSDADHGLCVVHGHTAGRAVEFRPNRIGVDTGAFATDTLSCVVLEGRTRRLLQT